MSHPLPRLLRGALLFAAAGLSGCASISSLRKNEPPPASAAPGAAADAAPVRLVAEYDLVVEAPGDLRDLLQEHLDLARFRSAPEDQRLSRQELGRLISGRAPAGSGPAGNRGLLQCPACKSVAVTACRWW